MDNMDNRPIDRLDELEKHLQVLKDATETPFDAKLFDDVELQLTPSNIHPIIPRLLPALTVILSTTPHDPSIIVSLAIKLLAPLKFTDILQLASEESLILALRSPAPSANLLALSIIAKASRTPSDTAILSIMQPLVAQLIRTWLSSPSVDVGEKATRALGDLLDVDSVHRPTGVLDVQMTNGSLTLRAPPPGQGLLWRRIFADRTIYASIYDLCSNTTIGAGEGQLDEQQKSLAQGRLLRLLPRLAVLDFGATSRSQFADVEARYMPTPQDGHGQGKGGLLWFASTAMVDKKDVLMHITLLDFFAELLMVLSEAERSAAEIEYLAALMREVVRDDLTMYKSLEALAANEASSPELVQLLARLNAAR